MTASVAVIASMVASIDTLAEELEAAFEQHPDAEVVLSLPGLGTILGARVLGEFGDDPERYANAKCRCSYRSQAASRDAEPSPPVRAE